MPLDVRKSSAFPSRVPQEFCGYAAGFGCTHERACRQRSGGGAAKKVVRPPAKQSFAAHRGAKPFEEQF
jgi:hypothetical protein